MASPASQGGPGSIGGATNDGSSVSLRPDACPPAGITPLARRCSSRYVTTPGRRFQAGHQCALHHLVRRARHGQLTLSREVLQRRSGMTLDEQRDQHGEHERGDQRHHDRETSVVRRWALVAHPGDVGTTAGRHVRVREIVDAVHACRGQVAPCISQARKRAVGPSAKRGGRSPGPSPARAPSPFDAGCTCTASIAARIDDGAGRRIDTGGEPVSGQGPAPAAARARRVRSTRPTSAARLRAAPRARPADRRKRDQAPPGETWTLQRAAGSRPRRRRAGPPARLATAGATAADRAAGRHRGRRRAWRAAGGGTAADASNAAFSRPNPADSKRSARHAASVEAVEQVPCDPLPDQPEKPPGGADTARV